jgi:ADP-ribose pyrophosphatase
MKESEKNPWKTLHSTDVFESPWIRVTKSEVLNPAGNPAEYGCVHFKHLAIGIVPIDKEKNIWLVGQYRYPLNEYSWEIPEGGGKLDVAPEESAKRELLEETGIVAQRFTEILKMHLSNSATDETSITFLASGLSYQEAQPEESEVLQLKKMPLGEAFQWVINGKITDAISVASILKLKWMDDSGMLTQLIN